MPKRTNNRRHLVVAMCSRVRKCSPPEHILIDFESHIIIYVFRATTTPTCSQLTNSKRTKSFVLNSNQIKIQSCPVSSMATHVSVTFTSDDKILMQLRVIVFFWFFVFGAISSITRRTHTSHSSQFATRQTRTWAKSNIPLTAATHIPCAHRTSDADDANHSCHPTRDAIPIHKQSSNVRLKANLCDKVHSVEQYRFQ